MMQLQSIRVASFRKFIEPVSINGLSAGVNIIAGDNEEGKSTILSALKAALYTKHSTTAVAAFQPYNSAALPEIELQFSLQGTEYRLRKTFGRKGTAELRTGSAVFSGAQAEEQLQTLLMLGQDKARECSGIWNVLWVEQGTAFTSPQVGDSGKRPLNQALENELGKLVSGNEAQALLSRISDLYGQWFTRKSNQHAAGSEYRQAEKELHELQLLFHKSEEEFATYQSTLNELESLRAEIEQFEREDRLAVAAQALTEARRQFDAIAQLNSELQRTRAQQAAHAAAYESISVSWRSRRQLIAELDGTQKSLSAIGEKLDQARAQFDAAAKQLHLAQENEQSTQDAWEAIEKEYAACQRSLASAQLRQQLAQVEQRLAKAQEAQARAEICRQNAAALKIDRARLENLRKLDRQLTQLQAQLQAIATRLHFKPLEGQCVWRDGVKLPGDDALLITEPATFVLDGFGELTVLPGGDNLETIAVAEKELRAKFQRALAGTGCQSILQAEEQEREKTRILAEGDEALRDVLKFAPAGIAALVDERDGLQARLRDSGGQSVAMAPQAVLEAEAMAEALRSKREQLKEQCAKQRTLVQQCSQSLAAVNAQLQALLAEQNVLNTQIAACEAKLQELRQQEADQALDQRMTEARVQWENITAQCTTLEAQLAGSSAELAQTCVAEAQAEVGRLQLHFQHLRERRSMLQGILQTFGKSGIAEEYCRLKDKYEQMQRHCQRLLLKANAIKLLHQTLLDCERRSKDGLTQPLLAQMKPYIERVFDQAAIVLDGDSYQITGLQRGTSMEAYGSLSLGTREQLSVLVRLAFAQVLTANGYPAIVVLDDALVYADETRFARMQSVIAEAAAKFQILVFTCRLRDWQHMRSPIFRIEQDVMSKSLALRSDGQLFVNAALEQVAQQP